MIIAKNRVAGFDYTLTGADKTVLDSSKDSGPLFYLHGHENIIPGLERALEGRAEGDSFFVTVPAADAYGERDESLLITVPLANFPPDIQVQEGMRFEAESSAGYRQVTVTRINGDSVMVDANHPMAGQDLNFAVEVRTVREASAEELAHGHIHSGCHESCDGCGKCHG
jgi:FKBP-type peptidyl-prolyl cis-trans isomerase SlyD